MFHYFFLIWGGMDLDPTLRGGLEWKLKICSVKTTTPHYAYVCVLRWNVWAVRGTCLAVAEHVLRMRGRPGRRGGSKACLSIGACYH